MLFAVGSPEVLVRAVLFRSLLVGSGKGGEDRVRVAGRTSVVRACCQHEARDRDAGAGVDRVDLGVVDAPLRQPAPCRRETGEPGGAVVGGAWIAQVRPAGASVILVDARIEPSWISHRAVHDEATLLVAAPSGPKVRVVLPGPGSTTAVCSV